MKRFLAGILTLAMLLVMTAAVAEAPCFVDADGDGLCDHRGGDCSFVDEDGDGYCDNAGRECRFVDEDSDGLCDHAGQNCRLGHTSAHHDNTHKQQKHGNRGSHHNSGSHSNNGRGNHHGGRGHH